MTTFQELGQKIIDNKEVIALEEKYGYFYAPNFEIWIDGQDIVKQQNIEIVSVSVDNTLDGADAFTFTVNNAFDTINHKVLWLVNPFRFGKQVEIKMGYANGLSLMIVGLITSIKTNFPSEGAPQMEVSGFDLSFKLMQNKETRTFNDLTDSEIAEKIATDEFQLQSSSEYPLTSVRDDSEIKYKQTVKQETESDFEFLQRLADRNYFEFFVFRNTLYFRKPTIYDLPIVTLEWGKSLASFSLENSVSEYIYQVQVKGQDTDNNKLITGDATSLIVLIEGLLSEISSNKTTSLGVETVNATIDTIEQAKRLAESKLKKLNEGFLKGSGESIGIPEILAGTNIQINGLGSELSKSYYIESSNHSITNSGYRTTFNVKDMSEVKLLYPYLTGNEEKIPSEEDSKTSNDTRDDDTRDPDRITGNIIN